MKQDHNLPSPTPRPGRASRGATSLPEGRFEDRGGLLLGILNAVLPGNMQYSHGPPVSIESVFVVALHGHRSTDMFWSVGIESATRCVIAARTSFRRTLQVKVSDCYDGPVRGLIRGAESVRITPI